MSPILYISAPTGGPALTDLLAGSYNGLAFDSFGTQPYVLDTMQGLDDFPDIRFGDAPRGQDDGAFLTTDFLGERTITLTLHVIGDYSTYLPLVAALKAAFAPIRAAELPLYVRGSTQLVNCRVTKLKVPQTPQTFSGYGVATVELVASDPRIYDANPLGALVAVAAPSSGRTYPRVYPTSYGVTTGGNGTFQMTNAGNYATAATAHIVGPIDTPRIEATDQGKKIQLAISLSATDFLDIDFKNHSIVLNGTASRRSALTPDSQWFSVPPGPNNFRFAESSSTAGGGLTFSFHSAWL